MKEQRMRMQAGPAPGLIQARGWFRLRGSLPVGIALLSIGILSATRSDAATPDAPSAIGASTGAVPPQCVAARNLNPGLQGKVLQMSVNAGAAGLQVEDPGAPRGWKGVVIVFIDNIAKCLGFDYKITGTNIAGEIQGLQQGRFDVAADLLRPNKERLKTMKMLLFQFSPGSFVTQHGNPKNIRAEFDLCGLRAAAIPGDNEIHLYEEVSKKCVAAGKPPIQQVMYADQREEFTSVANGRVDGFVCGATTLAGYMRANPNKVQPSWTPEGQEPSGWIFAKDNTALANALLAAWKWYQDSGGHQKALDDAGLTQANVSVHPAELRP